MYADLRRARWLWAVPLSLAGCIIDTDHPCGDNQVEFEGSISGCECAENAAPNIDGIGCTLCGANESVVNNVCTCNAGYVRLTAGGACTMSALGAACSASSPCGGDYPYCSSDGYCTTMGCTASTDCMGGYACDKSASPAYCARPPSGVGVACNPSNGNADCAAFDAKKCAQGTCVVSDCATGHNACFVDNVCCDLTSLIGDSLCIPSSSLINGKCPVTMLDPVMP